MIVSPEAPPRCYAMEKLAEVRRAVLNGGSALLLCRARVEQHRTDDFSRAREAFDELQRARDAIVQALRTARLAFLELEETDAAQVAGQLGEGLAGFDLMSPAYAPVYHLLKAFADQLPDGAATQTSAAVIGRLMNNVKLGYYPTDPDNIRHILRGIQFPAGVTTNLLDPCCGCGKALRQLAQGNNCFTYGVELDECRAEEAQAVLHRVAVGSYFFSRISQEAFHLMLLNPPYLSVLNEHGGRTRHEKRFLVETLPHLMLGGLLVYIIPYYRLTADVCRILSDNYADLSVWRFTDREFQTFKQAVVLGVRKRRQEDSAAADALERAALDPNGMACVSELEEHRYALPAVPKTVEVFKGEKFNEAELAQQLRRSTSFQRLLSKSELDRSSKRPLLPLSIGQIGLVGGSGMINGLIECEHPHIIKGRMVKQRRTETTDQVSSAGRLMGQEIREVISNKMVFNILTAQGFRELT